MINMKRHIYIIRVNYLRITSPIKLTDDITLIPYGYEKDGEEQSDVTINHDISFDDNSYSYLFIEKDVELGEKELNNEIRQIISLFSFVVSNQLDLFGFFENFHIHYKNKSKIILEQAVICPFHKYPLDRSYSLVYQKEKNMLKAVINKMYEIFIKKPISNSFYYIINEYLISKREKIPAIKAAFAWNTLEHMAAKYWEEIDKSKLYIISKKKFDNLIKKLKKEFHIFLDNNIDEDKDVLVSNNSPSNYRTNYRSLLNQGLSESIYRFSPILYKIDQMFKNEGIQLKDKEIALIKKMKRIRDLMYHEGLDGDKIEREIRQDPITIIQKFLKLLYLKIWEFFGFFNEITEYKKKLIQFKEIKMSQEELNKAIRIKNYDEKIRLFNNLETIHNRIEKNSDKPIKAEIIGKDQNYDIMINLGYNKKTGRDSLIIHNLPQNFKSYGNIIKIKTNFDNLELIIEFQGHFKFGAFRKIILQNTIEIEILEEIPKK